MVPTFAFKDGKLVLQRKLENTVRNSDLVQCIEGER